jgi:hypothetical protein
VTIPTVNAAQPTPVGGEFQVNAYATGDQNGSVAMNASGQFLVTWGSEGQDGSEFGIFARRYNSSGTAQAAEFQVNAYTGGDQFRPVAGMEADGDFVIAWVDDIRDGQSAGVFARRFDSSGTPKAPDFQVNTRTVSYQEKAEIAVSGDGRFVVVWVSSNHDGSDYGVFARRFDAAGVPQANEFQVNSFTQGEQFEPDVGMSGNGGFVVAWKSSEAQDRGIFARRFNSGGISQTDPFRVDLVNQSTEQSVAVGMSSEGEFVISWVAADGVFGGVFARRFDATGIPQAVEFLVNTETYGSQNLHRAAVDGDGDFVIAWTSTPQDGYSRGVFARRFDATGAAQAVEFQVNSSTLAEELVPAVATAAGGDFVITWIRFDGASDVFAQRYKVNKVFDIDDNGGVEPLTDGLLFLRYAFGFRGATLVAGAVAGNCIRCTQGPIESYIAGLSVFSKATAAASFQVHTYTAGGQGYASAAADADGDFVVAWTSNHDGAGSGIFARRFSPAGVPGAGEFQVNTYVTGSQSYPAVGMENNGDFAIAWQGVGDGANTGIFARRFNAAGVALGAGFQVNTHTVNYQLAPAIGMDGDGDFVVAWQSYAQDGLYEGIFARRFNSAGAAQGGEFQVHVSTSGAQVYPAVAMTPSGNFLVAWQSEHTPTTDIFARRFNAAGVAQGSEFLANANASLYQFTPAIAWSGADFVVVWSSYGQDGYAYGIFGRRFSSSGAGLGAEFQINSSTSLNQVRPAVVMDPTGSFVVSWETGFFFPYSVHGRRFDAAGGPQAVEFEIGEGTFLQGVSALAVDGRGDFIAAWTDGGRDGYAEGVFARRYNLENHADIDGNAIIEPLTDGLLVLRYLFGFRGATLINGAVAGNCTRCTSAAIEAFLGAKV